MPEPMIRREQVDRRESLLRWGLVALHTLLGVGAVAAGQAFVRDPSGSALGMSVDYLDGSPFPDFRIPGLFLAAVIGTANLVSAVGLWWRHPLAPLLSLATGLLLVIWVIIQTAIIGFRHWSQLIWWIIFPLVAVIAAALAHSERRGRTLRP